MKTVQWNIGGGRVRKDTAPVDGSYDFDGLFPHIIETLIALAPDIVTLQEAHTSKVLVQAEVLAKALGLSYWVNDVYAPSHIENGQGLSQAILSRFPLSGHTFDLFLNPGLRRVWEDGNEAATHDKGVTRALAMLPGGVEIEVKTLHAVPFRKFDVDPLSEAMTPIRESMMALCQPTQSPFLLSGDFNFNAPMVREYLPKLFDAGVEEIEMLEPTTPKGRTYDHILYMGMRLVSTGVISDVLTDHFPVVAEFEIV